MIISMGLVAPAYAARFKERTMRDWSPRQVDLAARCQETGKMLDVWNVCPRVKGAERIGTLALKEPPFKQNIKDVRFDFNRTYLAEGFGYMDDDKSTLQIGFRKKVEHTDKEYTILRFEPSPTVEANRKYTTPEMIAKYRAKLKVWMEEK